MISVFVDLNERKRTENALRESEKRFRAIIEGTGAGYFRIGVDGKFQYVNDAWLRMHGYAAPDEIVGRHFALTQVDMDLEQAQRNVESLLNGEPIPAGEFSRRRKDGSIGYHIFSTNSIVQDGNVVGLEGFLIDIAARKRMEEALQDAEEKYRHLSVNIPGMIYLFAQHPDGSYSFLYVSSASRELFDVAPDDAMRDWTLISGLMHPDDRERFDTSVRESAETLRPWREELRHIVNGEVRWYDCMSRPELQPNGDILWDGIMLETTDHKRTEEAVREREDRYRRLVESVTDYIYTVTIESGRPVATSHGPGCMAVTGYTSEEYAADPALWFRMGHDEDTP